MVLSAERCRRPRILVVRALQLGDLLCAVPALRALRHLYPTAHITLCSLPWAKEFVTRFSSYLDEFVEFPGYQGIPEQTLNEVALQRFIERACADPYDLVLQLHGSGPDINEFVATLGARQTAGFHPSDQPQLALDRSIAWPETGHEIERLKAIVTHLGAEDQGNELELPITREDEAAADEVFDECGLNAARPFICIHAGGRSLTRRWPVSRYAQLAEHLLDDEWQIVLTGASSERDVATVLSEALAHQCFNLVGKTTLGSITAVIDRARLLISNDTGVSHIAAARRTPSVVLVLGSDPSRWFPLNRELHVPVSIPVACRPCGHALCPIGFPCAYELSVELVYATVCSALNRQSDLHLERQRLTLNS